jgi:hypothetical protein
MGDVGRFGNQIFQYAFLRLYCDQYDQELQVRPWVGRHLFGHSESHVTERLPVFRERWHPDHMGVHYPPDGLEVCGHDWLGYAQYHTSYYAPMRDKFCDLFRPVESVKAGVLPALKALRSMGKTIIGVHYRLGDQGTHIFPITPPWWYIDWLQRNWNYFRDPVLFVSSEDMGILHGLSKWNPVTSMSLGAQASGPLPNYNYLPDEQLGEMPAHQVDFYPDHYLLSHCHIILGPNSTFSYTAAMLNEDLIEYHRASLPKRGFERVDPWDSVPLNHEWVSMHPHLAGICAEDWK